MKFNLLLIAAGLFLPVLAFSQSRFASKNFVSGKAYDVQVSRYSPGKGELKGYLKAATDSSIVLIIPGRYHRQAYEEIEIPVAGINELKIRRHHNIGRGMLIGGIGGFAMGFFVGYMHRPVRHSGNSSNSINLSPKLISAGLFTKTQNGLLYGQIGVIPGMLFGAMVGSVRLRIPIRGSMDTYRLERPELDPYRLR